MQGIISEIFYQYLKAFSLYKPKEIKIIIIDNAAFHSLSKYTLPDNIILIRVPPYSPELNPCEKIWLYIKQHYKNNVFVTLDNIKQWLYDFVNNKLNNEIIKWIIYNQKLCKPFLDHFNV
ncbi:transposase [Sabulilitoribacter arenilitoris]|uniref:Transposase n=1 Tax=Wocania arenilitoris TaxID=2044858 RepID=A0AAE3JPE8_9FLAO|nr:transposase [Wocania arenilitoris]